MINKKKYQVFHPDHEVLVQSLLGIKNAINSENFSELFEKAGFLDKQPDDWVETQVVLDIFNELGVRSGSMMDFVAIGMRIGADVIFPSAFVELAFVDKVFMLASQYAPQNRGTDFGYIHSEKLDAQHVIYRIKTPYPDDFWYGIFYSIIKRFLPSNNAFKAYYDKDMPRFEEGGAETRLHVEWWEKDSK